MLYKISSSFILPRRLARPKEEEEEEENHKKKEIPFIVSSLCRCKRGEGEHDGGKDTQSANSARSVRSVSF
ncbi:hypothetical protein OUZ56_007485 [Daphnia magna]|uniref:Uncharacterized protein n=1 Tax=Daphnia magna TaxID=35525 RepID=A0ABR0AAA3_9CRUS|nr:hypothetical protein OUZ56_007485 [Daphnia magna]